MSRSDRPRLTDPRRAQQARPDRPQRPTAPQRQAGVPRSDDVTADDPAFLRLAGKVSAWLGLDLDRGGRGRALLGFTRDRLRQLDGPTLSTYVDAIGDAQHPEIALIADAVTVGHTWFYRDAGQMELITDLLRHAGGGGPLYLWVAGCATGEDVYTLAMLAEQAGRTAHVLGTDINSASLAVARAGRYKPLSIRDVPEPLRRHLPPISPGWVAVATPLRQRVRFLRHNLLDPPPPSPRGRGWDLILCRNVLIYFRDEVTRATVGRLAQALVTGGFLVLGASEVLHNLPAGLRMSQRTGRYVLCRTSSTPPRPPPAPAPAAPEPVVAEARPVDLITQADRHLAANRTEEALLIYEQLLSFDPDHTEAHLLCGVAHHLRGEWAAAAWALRQAQKRRSDCWLASYYLALCLDRLGLPAQAQHEYRRVTVIGAEPRTEATARQTWRSATLGEIVACRADIVAAAAARLARPVLSPAPARRPPDPNPEEERCRSVPRS